MQCNYDKPVATKCTVQDILDCWHLHCMAPQNSLQYLCQVWAMGLTVPCCQLDFSAKHTRGLHLPKSNADIASLKPPPSATCLQAWNEVSLVNHSQHPQHWWSNQCRKVQQKLHCQLAILCVLEQVRWLPVKSKEKTHFCWLYNVITEYKR